MPQTFGGIVKWQVPMNERLERNKKNATALVVDLRSEAFPELFDARARRNLGRASEALRG